MYDLLFSVINTDNSHQKYTQMEMYTRNYATLVAASRAGVYTPTILLIGQKPKPTLMQRGKMKMKDKIINLRASEKEVKQINTLAKRAKMTRTDFIKHSVFNKEIVVLNGLKEFNKELKRIGENLNQLTKLSNIGNLKVVYLDDTKLELKKINDKLTETCELRNRKDALNRTVSCDEVEEVDAQENVEIIATVPEKTSPINVLGTKRSNSIFSRNGGV